MSCNGICEKHKALKKDNSITSRYLEGQKRCSTCEIFMIWNGFYCPCCNRRLRARSFRSREVRQNTKKKP